MSYVLMSKIQSRIVQVNKLHRINRMMCQKYGKIQQEIEDVLPCFTHSTNLQRALQTK